MCRVSQHHFFLQIKTKPAASGTSAATQKVIEPHWLTRLILRGVQASSETALHSKRTRMKILKRKIELTFATGFFFLASASGTGSGPALDFSVALLPSPVGL